MITTLVRRIDHRGRAKPQKFVRTVFIIFYLSRHPAKTKLLTMLSANSHLAANYPLLTIFLNVPINAVLSKKATEKTRSQFLHSKIPKNPSI
ncbi:hypothetical protein QBC45DRAFT_203579 [Copromyces sp. CBS 386.78]|nr:hypothetical protein QBC45DRAFT_203579 [Copromyces sp. CBS 386.78]